MDHKRMLIILRMVVMLAGNRRYTLRELMERFDLTERTAYRYLDTIESAGFILNRDNGNYNLVSKTPAGKTLSRLLHFSEEEIQLLLHTMSLMEGGGGIKDELLGKLYALYDIKAVTDAKGSFTLQKIANLGKAMRDKKKVRLHTYRSSHSETVFDRIVETFAFLPDNSGIWCYESNGQCKQFRLSRMDRVTVLDDTWQYETSHIVPFTDAFRMSAARPKCKVALRLNLKAYNLLIEEYPLSAGYIAPQDEGFLLTLPIADFHGIGRFVLGLIGDVQVISPVSFKKFLQERVKIIVDD